jgi:hypothetical protein
VVRRVLGATRVASWHIAVARTRTLAANVRLRLPAHKRYSFADLPLHRNMCGLHPSEL